MKKEILISLVLGVGLPLGLLALVSVRGPAPAEERRPLPTFVTVPGEQAQPTMVTVLGLGEMELEAYLAGVVLAEMPADFETEALKAQAVVARTYTMKRMEHSKHPGAPVCTDPGCCQAYRTASDFLSSGGSREALEKVADAVAATAGQVLMYDGALIDATYFSCSGGQTEAAVEVWGADVPYLQAVDSPGEEEAAHYQDVLRFSPGEFAELLGLDPGGDPAEWFGPVTETAGGGVDTMDIQGKPFSGTELRKALGLRSTAFTVAVEGGTVTVTTRGFGHRVGMSQYGAQAMAQEGHSYDRILAHYYLGTELQYLG